jgi:hypothetical protein
MTTGVSFLFFQQSRKTNAHKRSISVERVTSEAGFCQLETVILALERNKTQGIEGDFESRSLGDLQMAAGTRSERH